MYINQSRVKHVLGMANEHTDDFNCWGATKFIADPNTPILEWVDHNAMTEWLISNYKPIHRTEVREGDIVALFSGDEPESMRLVHTAFCVEKNRFVHKMGRNVARLETLNRVLKEYSRQADKFIFVRRNELCV